MPKKIDLSYTTINMVLVASHNWVNKQMKIKPEDRDYYHQGTDAHRIIQEHVSGKKEHEFLKSIKDRFPVVEQQNFDPMTKFVIPVNEKYNVIGYVDGYNDEEKKILEIKTSSNPWPISKFESLMQRKIYGLGFKGFKSCVLITCKRNDYEWEDTKPKVYELPYTEKDIEDAWKFIFKGIEVIESGIYTGGLDEEGNCALGYRCYYGKNCWFKRKYGSY